MSDPEYIISRSPLTGAWYRVTEWRTLGDGRIQAIEKEKIDMEDVPAPARKHLGDSGEETGASEYKIDEVLE